MMPVSQLVVLVSYDFWVQLVGSDLGRWRGILETGGKQIEQEGLRLQRRGAADEAAENEKVSTWHLRAICSFLRTFHREDSKKSPAASVLLATIPPHYPVCSE